MAKRTKELSDNEQEQVRAAMRAMTNRHGTQIAAAMSIGMNPGDFCSILHGKRLAGRAVAPRMLGSAKTIVPARNAPYIASHGVPARAARRDVVDLFHRILDMIEKGV